MEARQERPSLFGPAGLGERVVAACLLVRKLRIAKLDRPLLDVETELGKVERQFLEAAKKPDECDPVIGRKIAPEHRMLVAIGEIAQCVADLLAAHLLAVELWAHIFERPRACLRPGDLASLRIKLRPSSATSPMLMRSIVNGLAMNSVSSQYFMERYSGQRSSRSGLFIPLIKLRGESVQNVLLARFGLLRPLLG